MTKLVIFDGNAIMHRAYHALPPLNTRAGEPINAVYGLVSMLLKVIQDLSPTHIIFAFDRPEPTFRKEIATDYQAHRPEMDVDLGSQFPKAQEVVKAFKIPLYDKAGFEADDVIGTIVNKVPVDQVLIVTGDRDILQLVNKKIKLYMPGKGLSDAKVFGKNETIEKMGVPPEQIVDYKALVGDPSDNYKGVPGIGPKTAVKLLEDYKTLDNIYKNLDKIPDRTAKILRENKESAYLSQKLAKIVKDVDIDFDIEKANKWNLDNPEVVGLFEEFGFRTLTKRIKTVGKELTSKKQMSLM